MGIIYADVLFNPIDVPVFVCVSDARRYPHLLPT